MDDGGARPGGGKPKGTQVAVHASQGGSARKRSGNTSTSIWASSLDAMAAIVVGIKHLMMRDPKTGKFERVCVFYYFLVIAWWLCFFHPKF